MDRLALQQRTSNDASPLRCAHERREVIFLYVSKSVACRQAIAVIHGTKNRPLVRVAQAGRRFHEGIEHGLQIERRAADDLEHVGCRGLLLKRLAQIVGALAQLLEQSRVLDGDDGLLGEILDQRDLLAGERLHLFAEDRDCADQLVFLQHRHDDHGASTGDIDQCDSVGTTGKVGRTVPHITDVSNLMRPERFGKRGVRMRTDRYIFPQSCERRRDIVERNAGESPLFM